MSRQTNLLSKTLEMILFLAKIVFEVIVVGLVSSGDIKNDDIGSFNNNV